jgi:peptidoglycan/xylan/chitin deacetylase (PgdA/CDA1 family)
MVPRRYRVYVTVLLAVLLTGCTAGDASTTVTAGHASGSPSATLIASGQGGGGVVSATRGSTGNRSSSPSSASPASPTQSAPLSAIPSTGATDAPTTAGPSTFVHGGPFGSVNSTGTAQVALTFDDGPGGNTAQVLDLLKQYGIHATFCIIGRMIAEYNPDLIRREVAEGHTLCNHTWTHDLNLRTRSEAQIRAELQRTNDAIHAIVPAVPIRYFRNPGGNFSPLTIAVARSMGMESLDWNVDPSDWSRPGVESIINNVLSHTHPGSIILMHDGGGDRSQTVQALHTILPNLLGRFTLIPMPVPAVAPIRDDPRRFG